MNLKDLMAERLFIHSAAKSLVLDPSVDDQVSKQCEAISIVSENPLHWEFVVAASGFIRSRGETGRVTIPGILDIIREEPVQARTYFDAVTTLPTDQVLSAGIEVAQITEQMQLDVMNALSPAEDCFNQCREKPESEKGQCYFECLGLAKSVAT